MVTRPVMASMASAIRLNWRMVVIVTSLWRQHKSGTISIIGFCSSFVAVAYDTQRYYKSLFRSTSVLAKVLNLRSFCRLLHHKQSILDYTKQNGVRFLHRWTISVVRAKRPLSLHRERGRSGGDDRIRTGGWRFCRPLPYHLATSP